MADVAEYIAPGFIQHGPGTPSVPRGPEGYRELMRRYRTAFPDLHLTIDDLVVTEDKAAIRYHSSGTHQGEFEGLQPTGRHFEVTGIDIVHIAGGKITEAWQMFDTQSFVEQLGAAQPSPVGEAVRQR